MLYNKCSHSETMLGSVCFNVKDFFTKAAYKIVDIAAKNTTSRSALAEGVIFVGMEVFNLIKMKSLPKGDVITLAEISGIFGVKNTNVFLALCHPINVTSVYFRFLLRKSDYSVVVYCFVSAESKTGVEMEALCGVNSSLLTIYDVSKMISPNLYIYGTRLIVKNGGKSLLWLSTTYDSKRLLSILYCDFKFLLDINVAVVTTSDRVSCLSYVDTSGVLLCALLRDSGSNVIDYKVLPDDAGLITQHIINLGFSSDIDLIITTGGTGLTKHDVTSYVLKTLCTREVPGLGEKLRYEGSASTIFSWLSCTFSGIYKDKLLISLPGNSNAVRECFEILRPVLRHAIDLIRKK